MDKLVKQQIWPSNEYIDNIVSFINRYYYKSTYLKPLFLATEEAAESNVNYVINICDVNLLL